MFSFHSHFLSYILLWQVIQEPLGQVSLAVIVCFFASLPCTFTFSRGTKERTIKLRAIET